MHEILEHSAQTRAEGGADHEQHLLALNCAMDLARAAAVAGSGEAWAARALDALAPGDAPLALWRRWLRLRRQGPAPAEAPGGETA
jgi:hypothetical protein